jgi:hypothetical protein
VAGKQQQQQQVVRASALLANVQGGVQKRRRWPCCDLYVTRVWQQTTLRNAGVLLLLPAVRFDCLALVGIGFMSTSALQRICSPCSMCSGSMHLVADLLDASGTSQALVLGNGRAAAAK